MTMTYNKTVKQTKNDRLISSFAKSTFNFIGCNLFSENVKLYYSYFQRNAVTPGLHQTISA